MLTRTCVSVSFSQFFFNTRVGLLVAVKKRGTENWLFLSAAVDGQRRRRKGQQERGNRSLEARGQF